MYSYTGFIIQSSSWCINQVDSIDRGIIWRSVWDFENKATHPCVSQSLLEIIPGVCSSMQPQQCQNLPVYAETVTLSSLTGSIIYRCSPPKKSLTVLTSWHSSSAEYNPAALDGQTEFIWYSVLKPLCSTALILVQVIYGVFLKKHILWTATKTLLVNINISLFFTQRMKECWTCADHKE